MLLENDDDFNAKGERSNEQLYARPEHVNRSWASMLPEYGEDDTHTAEGTTRRRLGIAPTSAHMERC